MQNNTRKIKQIFSEEKKCWMFGYFVFEFERMNEDEKKKRTKNNIFKTNLFN